MTHTALDHLEGMPPYMMMQVERRLRVRIKEVLQADPHPSYGKGLRWRNEEEVGILAKWVLHRMMEKRINDGRQFDSILECSRKAFARIMFEHQLRAMKEEEK